MTWRKHFKPVESSNFGPISGRQRSQMGPARTNYSSYLPDVYTGSPNRIDRYQYYEVMDSDPEINAALDILAEFCTDKPKGSNSALRIVWRSSASNSEIRILGEYLYKWNKLQEFDTRMMRIVRNVFKFGDVFFIKDPETLKLTWVDPSKVIKIIVNESDGKKPEQYIIKDLSPNFEKLIATTIATNINPRQSGNGMVPNGGFSGASSPSGNSGLSPSSSNSNRWGLSETEYAIDAKHVVHLSLSEGMDNNYPFGNSLLENVYKVYKQKELLEDAILIYRIQRAPERRIFHIDCGDMPSHLAMAFVERVKNEIHQRRIPSQTGGQNNVIDSTYNTMAMSEDYFFPMTSDGRGSKVDTLAGGCFPMDTNVSLLDGRVLSIRDIETELKSGKELWTYSCEPLTGKIAPGLISWAGVTHKSAKVMKITLDNGESIICTPCHKFPQYDQQFKQAKDFKAGDILIPLHKRNENKEFFDNLRNKWKSTDDLDAVLGSSKTIRYRKVGKTISNIFKLTFDIVKQFWCGDWVELVDLVSIKNLHRLSVVSVEFLDKDVEVGTLTIDIDEIYHNYHTFALAVGVFCFNSNLGEIDDLKYFTNKLFRALRIPSSYLPTGADDSSSQFNDGRVGTAYIQELRFNKYCERLQSLIISDIDVEFKLYLESCGVNIDFSLFGLLFSPPLNFATYRQAEMDLPRIQSFSSIQQIPFISNRFALKRYLGWTDEEVAENERLWGQESGKGQVTHTDAAGELRGAGLSASGIAGDLGMAGDLSIPPDMNMGLETGDDQVPGQAPIQNPSGVNM